MNRTVIFSERGVGSRRAGAAIVVTGFKEKESILVDCGADWRGAYPTQLKTDDEDQALAAMP